MEPWLEHFARASFVRSGDTAHDLKTPLNVAVLNLELMRMRLRKLEITEDEKISEYARAVDLELRRLGRIFDAFFVFSAPPKGEGEPEIVDIAPICAGAAEAAGIPLTVDRALPVRAHAARIGEAFRLFFEGATSLLKEGRLAATREGDRFEITVSGSPESADFEPTRIFKFYYTDTTGNPDLSLATARLIAETYGGELNAVMESDKVVICISFPPGE